MLRKRYRFSEIIRIIPNINLAKNIFILASRKEEKRRRKEEELFSSKKRCMSLIEGLWKRTT